MSTRGDLRTDSKATLGGEFVDAPEAGVSGAGARVLGLVVALVCAVFPAVAVAAPHDTLVSSRSSGEGPPDGFHAEGEACGICLQKSGDPVISASGRYVAFWSFAHNLVPDDLNGDPDVFVRDHGASPVATTTLISRASDTKDGPGEQADGESYTTAMSPSARYVVFRSSAGNLAAGDGVGIQHERHDVFVRDRGEPDANGHFKDGNATTTLVSAKPDGRPVNTNSGGGVISADGRYVAFASDASGLVANDTNAKQDVFLRDLQAKTTTLMSRSSDDPTPAGGDAPSMSADGRYVAFTGGGGLAAGAEGGIFVRDRQANTTMHVAPGFAPALSADGRFLAYRLASNGGVFLRDLQADTTTVVSRASDGTTAGGVDPSISRDGRYVAFASSDTNILTTDHNNVVDVFVRDMVRGFTTLASRASGEDGAIGNRPSHQPAMSDGGFVAFSSQASNLVAGDVRGLTDVFRRELAPPPAQSVPSVSIGDVTVSEGDTGQVDARVTVSLSKASTGPVTITLRTTDDSAVAPADYVGADGTLSFAAGELTKTITVKVAGDMADEPDERFFVDLLKATGAIFTRSRGWVSISDDDPAAGPQGSWAPTSAKRTGIKGDAVLLSGPACRGTSVASYCGKVLVAGYGIATELYDPVNDAWSGCPAGDANCGSVIQPGNLSVSRSTGTTLTLLDGPECRGGPGALTEPASYCGKVLLVGGTPGGEFPTGNTPLPGGARVELYDPAEGKWRSCDSAATATAGCPAPYSGGPGAGHSATLLSDGRVLVAGGIDLDAFYIYNPALGRWGEPGRLYNPRGGHRAVLLEGGSDRCGVNCGKVLLVGGRSPSNSDDGTPRTADLVDPVAGTAAPTPALIKHRQGHSATLLESGHVLVTGGNYAPGQAEYFDPKAGPTGAWGPAALLAVGRRDHTATLLSTGRLLLAGGGLTSIAELYRFHGGTALFTRPGPTSATTATLLPSGPRAVCQTSCGKVLVTEEFGGSHIYTPQPEVTKLDPASGPAGGGTVVTIEGTGLASVTSVKFGDVEATSVTHDSQRPDGKLTALSPPHVAGSAPVVSVSAISAGGTSTATQRTQFTYTGVPTPGGDTTPGDTTPSGTAAGDTASSQVTSGAGGAQQTNVPAPSGGTQRSGAAGATAAHTRRARALRACLARVERHAARERRAARRGPPRARAQARRHLASHRASARRSCLARHGATPGPVMGLAARAVSQTEVLLSFLAAGSDGFRPPAARSYVVRQSLRPIRSARDFKRARSLCAGACRFDPERVGERLELKITDLRPRTTYYYAIAARDDASRRLGPRSKTISVKTR